MSPVLHSCELYEILFPKNGTMTPPALFWYIAVYEWATHSLLVDATMPCFYPNGIEATGDSPCNTDTEVSFCCGSSTNSFCYNNLLCQDGEGRVVRGSCTDDTWTDPACPQYCLSKSKSLIWSQSNTLLALRSL
jgi:hypothetical protein